MNDERNQKRDIVLFDGECNFCRTQIGWIRFLDRGSSLRFLSLHDPEVADLNLGITFDQMMEELWIVTPSGEKHAGADSIKYLTRRIPLLSPFAIPMHIPGSMPLWRFLYRKVAQIRYRIAGRSCQNGTCQIHLDKLK